MTKGKGYLIGSFSAPSWRQKIIDNVKNYDFDDARSHEQSSIGRLVSADLGSSETKPNINYVRPGKELGKMSFIENGVGYSKGQPIISIDGNEKKDSILEKISSYKLNSLDEGIEFLKTNNILKSNFTGLERKTSEKPVGLWKNILVVGNDLSGYVKFHNKNLFSTEDYINNLNNLPKEIDGVIANFENGWDNEALFFMGLAYGTNIPIIELEGNTIPYPPFLGVADKTFFGENRFKNLEMELRPLNTSFRNEGNMRSIRKAQRDVLGKKLGNFSRVSTKDEYQYVSTIGKVPEEIIPQNKEIEKTMSTNTDIVIANFDYKNISSGDFKKLQLAYNSKIPVIMLSENEEIEKSIANLTRRVMVGKDRFVHAQEYLKNLSSQHISDEALTYYNLMNKFNK